MTCAAAPRGVLGTGLEDGGADWAKRFRHIHLPKQRLLRLVGDVRHRLKYEGLNCRRLVRGFGLYYPRLERHRLGNRGLHHRMVNGLLAVRHASQENHEKYEGRQFHAKSLASRLPRYSLSIHRLPRPSQELTYRANSEFDTQLPACKPALCSRLLVSNYPPPQRQTSASAFILSL